MDHTAHGIAEHEKNGLIKTPSGLYLARLHQVEGGTVTARVLVNQ